MSWVSFRRWWAISLLVGLAAGLLWWGVTDTATFTITADGAEVGNDETRHQFGAVVNFVLIGAGACLLLGFAVAFFSDVSWPAVPAVALMSGQAAVLAWLLGGLLAPGDSSLDGPVGSTVQDGLGVDAVAPFIAWAAFGVAGVLLALWIVEHDAHESEASANRG
jgi:hypothetical protein